MDGEAVHFPPPKNRNICHSEGSLNFNWHKELMSKVRLLGGFFTLLPVGIFPFKGKSLQWKLVILTMKE